MSKNMGEKCKKSTLSVIFLIFFLKKEVDFISFLFIALFFAIFIPRTHYSTCEWPHLHGKSISLIIFHVFQVDLICPKCCYILKWARRRPKKRRSRRSLFMICWILYVMWPHGLCSKGYKAFPKASLQMIYRAKCINWCRIWCTFEMWMVPSGSQWLSKLLSKYQKFSVKSFSGIFFVKMIFMNFFRENDFMENSFCETLDAWNFVEKHDSAIFFWRKLAKKTWFFFFWHVFLSDTLSTMSCVTACGKFTHVHFSPTANEYSNHRSGNFNSIFFFNF